MIFILNLRFKDEQKETSSLFTLTFIIRKFVYSVNIKNKLRKHKVKQLLFSRLNF